MKIPKLHSIKTRVRIFYAFFFFSRTVKARISFFCGITRNFFKLIVPWGSSVFQSWMPAKLRNGGLSGENLKNASCTHWNLFAGTAKFFFIILFIFFLERVGVFSDSLAVPFAPVAQKVSSFRVNEYRETEFDNFWGDNFGLRLAQRNATLLRFSQQDWKLFFQVFTLVKLNLYTTEFINVL